MMSEATASPSPSPSSNTGRGTGPPLPDHIGPYRVLQILGEGEGEAVASDIMLAAPE